MNNNVEVSIICNTYNHEEYIRDALDSFIMQKTNFKFEVLVHDDASIDKTADIIREYEKKYPEIIKPIYQTENQYSKETGKINKIQLGRVRGKYIVYGYMDNVDVLVKSIHKVINSEYYQEAKQVSIDKLNIFEKTIIKNAEKGEWKLISFVAKLVKFKNKILSV